MPNGFTPAEVKDELTRVTRWFEALSEKRQKYLAKGRAFLDELKSDVDSVDIAAEVLADICLNFAPEHELCLEWLLDYYVAGMVCRQYDGFLAVHEALLKGRYRERSKTFEYFNDNHAFCIPHPTKRIVVLGKISDYDRRYLAVDETSTFQHTFHVRRIWRRTERNSLGDIKNPTLSYYRSREFEMRFANDGFLYGDCRDGGHVLTYQHIRMKNEIDIQAKCDHVIWDARAPFDWFQELKWLWIDITGQERGSYL